MMLIFVFDADATTNSKFTFFISLLCFKNSERLGTISKSEGTTSNPQYVIFLGDLKPKLHDDFSLD